MTPLPTATGCPASRGFRNCSTEAKKASMSRWRISGRGVIDGGMEGENGVDTRRPFFSCSFLSGRQAGWDRIANICSPSTLVLCCGILDSTMRPHEADEVR